MVLYASPNRPVELAHANGPYAVVETRRRRPPEFEGLSFPEIMRDLFRSRPPSLPERSGAAPAGLRNTQQLGLVPTIGPGSFFIPASATSIALAWRGGQLPFSFQVIGTRGLRGSANITDRVVIIRQNPNGGSWAAQVTVRVSDAVGSTFEVSLYLVPDDALPDPAKTFHDGSLAASSALWLLLRAPQEWRLEGLRRLAELAAAGDENAAETLTALQEGRLLP